MLKIEELEVFYGGVHALKGICLNVPKNSIVTLVGANGAGKSTTLRTICGLVRPRSGRMIFGDENLDLTTMQPETISRSGIALVPEGRRVFTNLTVNENLKMGVWFRKDKEGIEQDLEMIFHLFPVLKERLNQKAVTLSGGEQQMLSVSRAVMSKPRLLLLDEPSLGLAPLLVAQLFETIRALNTESNITILLVEQNVRAALKVAHYGYVLETGRVVLEGSAKDLASNQEVQAAYIGA